MRCLLLLSVFLNILYCRGSEFSTSLSSNFQLSAGNDISIQKHRQKVEHLSATLKVPRDTTGQQRIVLKRTSGESHCVRPHDYKLNGLQLDISDMRNILKIEYIRKQDKLNLFDRNQQSFAGFIRIDYRLSSSPFTCIFF